MIFEKAKDVGTIVWYLKAADEPRSSNRALINSLANGDPPYTDNEQDENNINTNVNFLDMPKILHDARNTLYNGFLKPGHFFKCINDDAPVEKKLKYESIVTKEINKIMKRSSSYTECLRSEFAQMVVHGVGPSLWEDKYKWCPYPVGIEDLLIPSRTRTSFDNLPYFAVRRQYTPFKLYEMTHGKSVDKAWNMPAVKKILAKYQKDYMQTQNESETNPEKLAERMKSDVTVMSNDSAPTINCWDFYFRSNDTDEETWNRRIILDSGDDKEFGEEFLYNPGKRNFASGVQQILSVMIADGANVAPFQYHSVRGLGWLLYAVCELQNRLLCKLSDSTFEQMMWYFRVGNPDDKERLNKIDLHHLGIIPEGTDFVKAQERYTPNIGIIQNTLSLNRQSMSESASQFKSDLNDGTKKEMTAQEVMARMNAANALIGSMLNLAYIQKTHQYREILRRFFLKDSRDKDVVLFQKRCKKQGVPEDQLDPEKWEVEPVVVLGSGNKTLEIAQAKELMAARGLFDPEPQREILHDFTLAITDDPRKAARWVPIKDKQVSDSVHDAQLSAATLMMGMPLSIKTGMNHIEYVEALLTSMSAVLARIEQTGNMAEPNELAGLQNMAAHIEQHIQLLAQDEQQKQKVKGYANALGQLMNLVKGLEQRLAQKMEAEMAQGGISPESQAKIKERLMLAQANVQIKNENAAQKRAQKEADFAATQARKDMESQAEMGAVVHKAETEAAAIDIKNAAKIKAATPNDTQS